MSLDETQGPLATEHTEHTGEDERSADYAAEWQPETPFESLYDFVPEATPSAALGEWTTTALETPFVSEYGQGAGEVSLEGDALRELLFELHDSEMDRAVGELVQEAAAAVPERVGMLGEAASGQASEHFLDEWIDPVRQEAATMLDGIAEGLEQVDVASLGEDELDRFFERFEPQATGLEQHFEDFLGSLWKKAKKVVAGAINVAKKGVAAVAKAIPGVSGLIGRLKALVEPLLKRVLSMAMDRLPPGVRPIAVKVARSLIPGFKGEAEAEESLDGQPAVPDPGAIQRELDEAIASLVLAGDEAEQEATLAEQLEGAERVDGAPLTEYQEARAEFVDRLERGEDPRQALEQFIPAVLAVLPIARTVIGLIGRPRVVEFIAGYVAKLIERYVGAAAAKQLSQSVVDIGLGMIGLETPPEGELHRLAPEVIAGTVEDTVRRVAELDETSLEHPQLLEAATNQAFHEAAAENFPSTELVPEVQEASRVRAAWVPMPVAGRRKYYKKYTHVFDVEITSQMADSIQTFGGKRLAAFLRDRLGVAPPVRARVHLYQTLPGGWPSRIARFERIARGTRAKTGWMQLHPLTGAAAATLLQQPKLGRAVSGRFRSTRGRTAIGQRLYYLEISGARTSAARRSSEVNVALDFPADEYRVSVFLGEADAQEVAAKLRRRELPTALTVAKRVYAAGVGTALGGDIERHVKIKHEAVDHEESLGGALKKVAQAVLEALSGKVVEWVGKATADYLEAQGAEFVSATEDPAEGVTVVVTIKSPPGSPLIRKLLKGEPVSPADLANPAALFAGAPQLGVKTSPGFRFD